MPRRTPVRELQQEEPTPSSPLRRSSRISNNSPVPPKIITRRNSATEAPTSTPKATRGRRSSFTQESDGEADPPKSATRSKKTTNGTASEEESAKGRSKEQTQEAKKPATRRRRSVDITENEEEPPEKTTRSRSGSLSKKSDQKEEEAIATPVKKTSPRVLEAITEAQKESDSPVAAAEVKSAVKKKKTDFDLSIIAETSLTEEHGTPQEKPKEDKETLEVAGIEENSTPQKKQKEAEEKSSLENDASVQKHEEEKEKSNVEASPVVRLVKDIVVEKLISKEDTAPDAGSETRIQNKENIQPNVVITKTSLLEENNTPQITQKEEKLKNNEEIEEKASEQDLGPLSPVVKVVKDTKIEYLISKESPAKTVDGNVSETSFSFHLSQSEEKIIDECEPMEVDESPSKKIDVEKTLEAAEKMTDEIAEFLNEEIKSAQKSVMEQDQGDEETAPPVDKTDLKLANKTEEETEVDPTEQKEDAKQTSEENKETRKDETTAENVEDTELEAKENEDTTVAPENSKEISEEVAQAVSDQNEEILEVSLKEESSNKSSDKADQDLDKEVEEINAESARSSPKKSSVTTEEEEEEAKDDDVILCESDEFDESSVFENGEASYLGEAAAYRSPVKKSGASARFEDSSDGEKGEDDVVIVDPEEDEPEENLGMGSSKRQSLDKTSITMQDYLKAGEDKEKNLSERLHKVVDVFCAGIKNQTDVAINVSLEYAGNASEEDEDLKSDVLQISMTATSDASKRTETEALEVRGSKRRKIDNDDNETDSPKKKEKRKSASILDISEISSESPKEQKKKKTVCIDRVDADKEEKEDKITQRQKTPFKTSFEVGKLEDENEELSEEENESSDEEEENDSVFEKFLSSSQIEDDNDTTWKPSDSDSSKSELSTDDSCDFDGLGEEENKAEAIVAEKNLDEDVSKQEAIKKKKKKLFRLSAYSFSGLNTEGSEDSSKKEKKKQSNEDNETKSPKKNKKQKPQVSYDIEVIEVFKQKKAVEPEIIPGTSSGKKSKKQKQLSFKEMENSAQMVPEVSEVQKEKHNKKRKYSSYNSSDIERPNSKKRMKTDQLKKLKKSHLKPSVGHKKRNAGVPGLKPSRVMADGWDVELIA